MIKPHINVRDCCMDFKYLKKIIFIIWVEKLILCIFTKNKIKEKEESNTQKQEKPDI